MRHAPRRSMNPGYRPPKDYLREGLFTPDGSLRPELRTNLAASLGRQFLIEGIPFELVDQAAKELETSLRLATDAADARQRAQAIAVRPAYQRHPLLGQLLSAGAALVKRKEDLAAFATHVRRAYVLANFERVLGSATLAEKERAARKAHVRKSRRQHRPGR